MVKSLKTKIAKVSSDIDESNDDIIEEEQKQKKESIELSNEIITKSFEDLQNSISVFKALCEKKNKKEFNFEDIDVTSQKLNDILCSIEILSKLSVTISKYQQKIISKRKSFKKKDNINAEPRKPSGFTKPMDVPPNFKNFFSKNILITEDPVLKEKYGENFNINDQHPRTTLTGIVFAYIRSKELYTQPKAGEKLNKRLIRLDQPLKELFNVTNNEINGFKDFQTHMGNLYPKKPIESPFQSD
jgi:hypothetical protein